MKWGFCLIHNYKGKLVHNVFVDSEVAVTKCEGSAPLEKKIIRNFIDLLILKHLKTNPLVSGYEILNYLRQKFDIAFRPGTIYSAIYSSERRKLIKGNGDESGRTYELTNEGEKMVSDVFKARRRIERLVVDIFSEEYF